MNIRTAINDYVETHRIENHSDWTVSHRLEHLTWFADRAIASHFWNRLYRLFHNKSALKTLLCRRALQAV